MTGPEDRTPPTPPVPLDAGEGVGTDRGEGSAPPRAAGRRPRPIFLLIGIVVAVGLGIGLFTGVGTHQTPKRTSTRPQAGGPVPTFSLAGLSGGRPVGVPSDGGGHGRAAVVLFFASWCGPCQGEVPDLAATYHRQQADRSRLAKVALIGVDTNDPTGAGRSFVDKAGVTFPVAADRHATVANGLFAFTGLPEAVIVNGDGTIAAIHYGALSTNQLAGWERRLLTKG